MKVLPLNEVKTGLSRLINELTLSDEPVVVTKHGKAAAYLVSPSDYASLQETQAVLSDAEFKREVASNLAVLDQTAGQLYTLAELFED